MVEATAQPHDDDEKYLYGENTDPSKTNGAVTAATEVSSTDSQPTTTSTEVLPSQEAKQESQDEEEEDDEEGEFEEESDDDDIQVHIGEVNTATPGPYGTPVNWKKDSQTATTVATNKLATLPTQGPKKIDVNAVGLINGQPIYEYDLDTEQDEKPWRKPGADISDYFNYGFNEETWKQYCDKQRRMRMESQRSPYTVTPGVGLVNPSTQNAQVEIEVLPDGRTRVKAGPPPDRKVEGSIHVLGSTEDARRKQKEDELLALALNSTRVLPPGFPGQRPLYTALPNGAVVYNPIPGQPMPPQMLTPLPPSSQADNSQENQANSNETPNASEPQQIQSLGGGPPVVQYIGPGGPQLPPGIQQMIPNQPPVFQPPGAPPMGMEFQQDPFNMHPGVMVPPMGGNFNQFAESDSERESEGEDSRRHRSSRRESRHRRHRERSDRERSDRDKDRDHRDRSSRRERERGSDTRRSHDHSKNSSSDRRSKHSSRTIKTEDDGSSDRKPRVSSRRSRESHKPSSGDVTVEEETSRDRESRESREPREARESREARDNIKKEPSEKIVAVKQEPGGGD